MSSRTAFVRSIAFLSITFSCHHVFAQSPPEADTQKHAEALIEAARQLSDIRTPGASPFRLNATFTFVGDDLGTVNGTYTEVWVSKSQWRREINVDKSQQIEVANSGKLWVVDKPEDFPDKAKQITGMMGIFSDAWEKLEFASIADHADKNPPTLCAITKAGPRHEKHTLCFEKNSGGLIEFFSPRIRPTNVVEYACGFGMFKQFRNHLFPREIACFEDRHRVIDAKVVDLVDEPKPDLALFEPLPGAIELGLCNGKVIAVAGAYTPTPVLPFGLSPELYPTIIRATVVVDTKGRPQNIRLSQTKDKLLNESALKTLREWRFKPATCDGTPMATQVDIDTGFLRLRHFGEP
jgi:TonB family protein